MSEKKYYILGMVIGLLLGVLITSDFNQERRYEADTRMYHAVNDATNHSVSGVWFPYSTFCISMDRDNVEGLKDTIAHEFLHELIENNRGCGNETCWEHFCGGN